MDWGQLIKMRICMETEGSCYTHRIVTQFLQHVPCGWVTEHWKRGRHHTYPSIGRDSCTHSLCDNVKSYHREAATISNHSNMKAQGCYPNHSPNERMSNDVMQPSTQDGATASAPARNQYWLTSGEGEALRQQPLGWQYAFPVGKAYCQPNPLSRDMLACMVAASLCCIACSI